MGRFRVAQAAKLVFRDSRDFQLRPLCKAAETSKVSNSGHSSKRKKDINRGGESACWGPHPRTGIFIPEGQEQVMDDVPDGAASSEITFWLRNEDGVDKPDDSECYVHDLHSNRSF